MRLSGSMLFCLCYVRLVQPVFLPEDDPMEGLKHVGDILNPF